MVLSPMWSSRYLLFVQNANIMVQRYKVQLADLIFKRCLKLKQYHNWWYRDRDHDQDGICEYGSTDGSLIAAMWESGMDNAVRFDDA